MGRAYSEVDGAGGSGLAQKADWDTMLYLSRFGYGLVGSEPELHLNLEGHMNKEGHSKYEIRCALRLKEEPETRGPAAAAQQGSAEFFNVLPMIWTCWKRLGELRDQLYEPVRRSLGSSYEAHFAKAPFALMGGPPGTTDRLELWMGRLAEIVNKKLLPVKFSATLLSFLEAPAPEEGDDGFLRRQSNFREERRLPGGALQFVICEWRSDWQVELKAKILGLGVKEADWDDNLQLQDDHGAALRLKCREDGHPYVVQKERVTQGQPINFPVLVTAKGVPAREDEADQAKAPQSISAEPAPPQPSLPLPTGSNAIQPSAKPTP